MEIAQKNISSMNSNL